MNKDIHPAITPLNLGHMIKLLKTVGACREDTNRPGPNSYLAGEEGWA